MATKKNQRKKKTRGPDKHGKGSASAAKDHSQNAPMQQTLPEDTLSQKSFTENALPQYGRVLEKVDLAETPAPSAEMNIKYSRTNELVSPPISTTDPQSTLRDTDQENVGPGSENLTDIQKVLRGIWLSEGNTITTVDATTAARVVDYLLVDKLGGSDHGTRILPETGAPERSRFSSEANTTIFIHIKYLDAGAGIPRVLDSSFYRENKDSPQLTAADVIATALYAHDHMALVNFSDAKYREVVFRCKEPDWNKHELWISRLETEGKMKVIVGYADMYQSWYSQIHFEIQGSLLDSDWKPIFARHDLDPQIQEYKDEVFAENANGVTTNAGYRSVISTDPFVVEKFAQRLARRMLAEMQNEEAVGVKYEVKYFD
ncbi:MAG: hypothetical protein MMC33_010864 [Icmadophila ericetorum]|nr:hypothetical protein [Icmadophila ericetorum]